MNFAFHFNLFVILLVATWTHNAIGSLDMDEEVALYQEVKDVKHTPFLLQLRDKHSKFFCAATLIAPKYALTAAECFNKMDFSDVTVVGMATNVTEHGVRRHIEQIYKYPKKIVNAVVLQFYEPFHNLHPIELTDRPISDNSEMVLLLGWRHLARRISVKKTLHTTAVKTTPQNECETLFYAADLKKIFCIVGDGFGDHLCCSDAGGPVFLDGKLLGIVSKGYNCGDPDYILSVTSVYEILQFIEDIMKREEENKNLW